ncbi:MAG: sulfatase activating formylglycine-generating enzyme [Planctomycetota bacterium]|jgi:formylglycine-generating enzyme required for sulfatase activity
MKAVLCISLLLWPACGEAPPVEVLAPAPAWALVLEQLPDPLVVTDPVLRERIEASGLPWRVRHQFSGIEMLLVPTGDGLRGAEPEDEEASADERPAHVVHVLEPYYLGRFEVTQAQWRQVLGSDPSFFAGEDQAPVEQVDRASVQQFLMEADLQLPTESQWEVACRAGSAGARYGELEEVSWTRKNAKGRAHLVGQLQPNALGFYDLLGNVWEWTSSGFSETEYERCAAGVNAAQRMRFSTLVVLRGGSWYDAPRRARASSRYFAGWDLAGSHVGLRVLRKP